MSMYQDLSLLPSPIHWSFVSPKLPSSAFSNCTRNDRHRRPLLDSLLDLFDSGSAPKQPQQDIAGHGPYACGEHSLGDAACIHCISGFDHRCVRDHGFDDASTRSNGHFPRYGCIQQTSGFDNRYIREHGFDDSSVRIDGHYPRYGLHDEIQLLAVCSPCSCCKHSLGNAAYIHPISGFNSPYVHEHVYDVACMCSNGHFSRFSLHDEIQYLCAQGQLKGAFDLLLCLDGNHILPTTRTYLSLLNACNKNKSVGHTRQLHAHLAQHGLELSALLGDFLAATFAKCGSVEDACRVAFALPRRTIFCWTALICGFAEYGQGQEALKLYQCMQEDGVEPDQHIFVGLLKACGSMPNLEEAHKVLGDAQSKGFSSNIFLCNTLISLYGKYGSLTEGESVFNGLFHRNSVSWNVMLSAYAEQGEGTRALLLFRQMQEEGVTASQHTFVSILQACCDLMELSEGNSGKFKGSVLDGHSIKLLCSDISYSLHADAQRKGFMSNMFVCNSLVNLYGKCRSLLEAEHVFVGLSQPDVLSWTLMLSAYLEVGHVEMALQMYRQLQEEGEKPTEHTFILALQACSALIETEVTVDKCGQPIKVVSLEICQALHGDSCRMGFGCNVYVGSTFVSVYGKCGSVVRAENTFELLLQPDVAAWNAMLSACIEQGQFEKALQLYKRMQEEREIIDDITLVYALQASSETGSLEICREVHFNTIAGGYDLIPFMANTLIHAYGNCASMGDAEAVFHGLHQCCVVSWSACVAGYAQEGNCLASLQIFEDMQRAGVSPDDITLLSLLSACSRAGLVVEGVECFNCMVKHFAMALKTEHHVIMIDLLGRAGHFKWVEKVLEEMPIGADLSVWLSVLGMCRMHGLVELGKYAFDCAVQLQPKDVAVYVLMANIYADAGLLECVYNVEKLRESRGAFEMLSEGN